MQDSGTRRTTRAGMSMTSDGKEQCIGRFQFNVPAELSISGRSQSIYRVKVNTAPRPQRGLDDLLKEQVSRLGGGKATVVRTFDLEPGVRAAWYIEDPGKPQLRGLLAVKDGGDHAFVATRNGEASKSAGVESLVKTVVDSYVPAGRKGFCVELGAIVSEPGLNEETLIVFSDARVPELELEFSTRTVSSPDTTTYSNLDEEKTVAASHGGTLTVLRDQPRRVAGLQGKEIWMMAEIPQQKPLVRYTWHFAGVPQNSAKPMINIKGIAPSDKRGNLESIWETVLESIRAVPPAQ